jgi:hypothetical protein
MHDGIYKIEFSAPSNPSTGFGGGLVTIKGDTINGGDHGFVYRGPLRAVEAKCSGRIHVSRWNPAVQNVFPGQVDFELEFNGEFDGKGGLKGVGQLVGNPALLLTVTGHKVSDAA